MTKPGCHACGKEQKIYAVRRWKDLAHWCSTECWIKEQKAETEKARAHREYLLTGVRYIDPTGK